MNSPGRRPESAFARVNGVNLHYLDWGGEGRAILLLAGFGNSATIFSAFATHFSDRFHVLALTRRCHGRSELTTAGHDIDTRVDDIARFLEHLEIHEVIMIGHSMAGDELTRFTQRHPERVDALVNLDAALERDAQLAADDPLRDIIHDQQPEEQWPSLEQFLAYYRRAHPIINRRWDVWHGQLLDEVDIEPDGTVRNRFKPEIVQSFTKEMQSFKPDYSAISCPALSFYALADTHPRLPKDAGKALAEAANSYYRDVVNGWKKDCARRFRQAVEQAVIVEVPGADHYLFLDKEEEVAQQIRRFLVAGE